MIQMDIPAAFVCSQIFAWSGRRSLARAPSSWSGKYSLAAVAFALGVIGPAGVYLYSGWPEWEMMYWFEVVQMRTGNFGNSRLALVAPLFLLALGVAALVGFKLAHDWIRGGREKRVWRALWLGVALSLAMVAVTPYAPMLVGHYGSVKGFLGEALASGDPSQYGVYSVGAWHLLIPWQISDRSLLAKHGIITFFNGAFFWPWLIDIVCFVSATWLVARAYRRIRPEPAAS